MKIELNKEYSQTDLAEILGISLRTFRNREKECKDWLKNYGVFELTQGKNRQYLYIFKFIFNEEVDPLPRKNCRKTAEAFYFPKADEIIKESPRNTVTNIGRKILKAEGNQFNHSEGTIANYLRPHINETCLKSDYKWCRLDKSTLEYTPITEEQYVFLRSLMKKDEDEHEEPMTEQIFKLKIRLRGGQISRDEMIEELISRNDRSFSGILATFKEEYGFTPIYVPYIEKMLNFKAELAE